MFWCRPSRRKKQKITSFVTTIDLELKDATKDKGGHVALDVAYLEFQEPKRKQPTTLLRYESRSSDKPVVRGQDKLGPWHLSGGKPQDLTGAEQEEDLKSSEKRQNFIFFNWSWSIARKLR